MTPALALAAGALALAALGLLLRLRRLERRMARLRHRARRYAGAATHELHTPLSAILGYQELLADGVYGPLEPQAREAVERIGRSARQLVYLVDGLVDAVLLDAGALQLDTEPVRLAELFQEALDDARALAAERGGSASGTLPDRMPTIRTDRDRLRRVLGLAVIAAVRASGGRELRVSAHGSEGAAEFALEGTGVRPGALALAAADDEDHLSLRLLLAARIARALGGDVAVTADGAASSTVRVRIAVD